MKKRVIAGLLIALAVCSITACGKKKDKEASVISGSVVTSELSVAQMSQTPETSQTAGSQTPEAVSNEQTGSQTQETAQTAGAQTVPAGISLEENMSSVSYVLLARMISEQEGNGAYDAETKENGDSFWKELNYLVSAYGVNNKKISFD